MLLLCIVKDYLMSNNITFTTMKKMMIALTMMLAFAATGNAMSYEQARNEALFLTDKMAYELNLTDEQYEAAYEINLDYLMGVTSYDDVYGTYWERRNQDLSYVLLDWQWNTFIAASYFYRPLYWRDGYWHFGVYARYPHRDYFYFGRPVFYASYRGGHAWHVVGGRGYYYGRRDHFHPVAGRTHFGMHDRWQRGDFHHVSGNRHISHGTAPNSNGHFGGMRNSSTRTTVNQHGRPTTMNRDGYTMNRGGNTMQTQQGRTLGNFGGSQRQHTTTTAPTTRTENRGSFSTNRSAGSFGSSRSSSSFGSSRPSGSFGGSHRVGGNSSSGGTHGSHSGGGHFGGGHR